MSAYYVRGALALLLSASVLTANAQRAPTLPSPYENAAFLRRLYADTAYTGLKRCVSRAFATVRPGQWSKFVQGIDEDLVTQQKLWP